MALMKPGAPVRGNLESMREYVASVIARWLGVRVPEVELYMHPLGPAALSVEVGKTVLTWQAVMNDPIGAALRPMALADLSAYTGVIALDALIGATDRLNAGNLLYAEDRREWFSIDYSFSFGTTMPTVGAGDPLQPYGTPYFPEIVQAVAANPEPLKRSMRLAIAIPDDSLRGLLEGPPEFFADTASRGLMLDYIKKRRSLIDHHIRSFCQVHGIGPVTL